MVSPYKMATMVAPNQRITMVALKLIAKVQMVTMHAWFHQ